MNSEREYEWSEVPRIPLSQFTEVYRRSRNLYKEKRIRTAAYGQTHIVENVDKVNNLFRTSARPGAAKAFIASVRATRASPKRMRSENRASSDLFSYMMRFS